MDILLLQSYIYKFRVKTGVRVTGRVHLEHFSILLITVLINTILNFTLPETDPEGKFLKRTPTPLNS